MTLMHLDAFVAHQHDAVVSGSRSCYEPVMEVAVTEILAAAD